MPARTKYKQAYAVVSHRGAIVTDHADLFLVSDSKKKAKDDLAWAEKEKPSLKPKIVKAVIYLTWEA